MATEDEQGELAEDSATDTTIVVEGPTVDPPDQTVVVEDTPPNDPTDALDFAERVRNIIREENAKTTEEIYRSIDERFASHKPEPAPVVVVSDPTPAPKLEEEPVEEKPKKKEKEEKDTAPPKARAHPYFRPLGKGRQ